MLKGATWWYERMCWEWGLVFIDWLLFWCWEESVMTTVHCHETTCCVRGPRSAPGVATLSAPVWPAPTLPPLSPLTTGCGQQWPWVRPVSLLPVTWGCWHGTLSWLLWHRLDWAAHIWIWYVHTFYVGPRKPLHLCPWLSSMSESVAVVCRSHISLFFAQTIYLIWFIYSKVRTCSVI